MQQDDLASDPIGTLSLIPIESIVHHPQNPREDFDVDPLAESLSDYRLLSPILVRRVAAGFQIIAGHRRLEAAKKNGWTEIWAVQCKVNDQQALELLAAENHHRKNLNVIELARLVNTLHEPLERGGAGWTDARITKWFGRKDGSWAANMRRLLQLPPAILDKVKRGELPQSAARALLAYRDNPAAFPRIVADMEAAPKQWRKREQIEQRAAALARGESPARAECHPSDDFTSVIWYGEKYEFNKTQAAIVKLLWEEWKKGGLALSEKNVGERIGSGSDRFRLAHTFRSKGGKWHPAWGVMIFPAGRGKFRLSAATPQ